MLKIGKASILEKLHRILKAWCGGELDGARQVWKIPDCKVRQYPIGQAGY